MERFTNSIQASLNTNNWLAALFMALALPDICGALEDPNRPVGDRYKDWFNRYLKAAYDPANMYELVRATSPEILQTLPRDTIESMKSQPTPPATLFTAEDCYRLRCKCLHQGLPERMGQDRIHFTAPDPNRQISFHRNSFNGVLQISVEQFCIDVCQAVLRWWSSARNDAAIVARKEQLIKIYGLDAQELPLVRYSSN